MTAVRREERSFIDPHGIRIVYDLYEPDETRPPVRGAVQILHGVGEHAGRYTHVAEALTAAGFLVTPTITADTGAPAWSKTAVMRATRSTRPRWAEGQGRGLRTAERHHPRRPPRAPLILIGHSWGSFLAQMPLDRHPRDYDALVLTGSARGRAGPEP